MSNKNVFSCCLKAERVKPGYLMPTGRVFHDTEPDEQKARGPSVTVRVLGTRSWKPSAEWRCDRPVTVESGTQNDDSQVPDHGGTCRLGGTVFK